MAYETGSATGIQDLLSKLFTFATGLSTTPWTQDEFNTTNRYATLHLGDCYVSFRWDNSTMEQCALFQSLGFSGPNVTPENHTDDSGNGSTTSPATTGRRIDFVTSGALVAYYFFAGEGSEPYIHVVVEWASNQFVHFGFGNLVKLNDWTGGEYCYGYQWNETSTYIDSPTSVQHSAGMDDGSTSGTQATLHCEGLDNQDGSSKWGVLTSLASPGNDRGGNPRIQLRGGARGNLWGYIFGWIPTSQLNAYKPLIPIDVIYVDQAGTTDAWRWLGYQPDVAIVNMKNLAVGQEITIGSDTWKVFPWNRKQYTIANVRESWNAGWAYKKIA